jgi:hypothetical protein
VSTNLDFYKKATKLAEVDNAVRLDVPITPDHPFYTDFSDVRGDFEDRMIYKTLNVDVKTLSYNRQANQGNKVLLFLAGMRGSGKTTELAKITGKLHKSDCFFCVTCNLDTGLDINDLEYMDILIHQIERLIEDIQEQGLDLDNDIVASLHAWFSERVKEVNKVIKKEGGFEIEIKAETPSLFSFLGIAAKLKSNLQGSKENADKIRTVFKNNFTVFAQKTNEFFEYVNMQLRKHNIAQELLFVVDGMEKVATTEIRKKIIIGEAERIRQIKINTIFSLPIELMSETQKLQQINAVVSFPFVKIRERNGTLLPEAIARFTAFVTKRIDEKLFDSRDTIEHAILMGGGSPRELLRILEYANLFADDELGIITREALEKGIKKMAAQTSQYVTIAEFALLKTLKEDNQHDLPTATDETWQELLEKLIVLEYNDGTYKRVHPVIEVSELYKRYVG